MDQVVQAQDGSFIGRTYAGGDPYDDTTWIPYMVAFNQNGSVRWSVANEEPQMVTQDGGVMGKSGTVYDPNGSATGQTSSATQSWTGNEYVVLLGSLSSISLSPQFPAPVSFWAHIDGNASGNGAAAVQCPCLLQSNTGLQTPAFRPVPQLAPNLRSTTREADASFPWPPSPPLPPKTFVILEGEPGMNLPGQRPINVENLFHLSALTEQDRLNLLGHLAGAPIRISSVQDFAAQLIGNGPITGGVVFFGHGMGQQYRDRTSSSGLAPGQLQGPDTNITAENVNLLNNDLLDIRATITLHACYAGYGIKRSSIAQLIANRLKRDVWAPVAGTFFTRNPYSEENGLTAPKVIGDRKPVYLIQDNGVRFRLFSPPTYR